MLPLAVRRETLDVDMMRAQLFADVAEDAVVTPEEPLKEIVARGIPAEAISTLRAALQVENLTRKNAYILKAAEQMGISPEG